MKKLFAAIFGKKRALPFEELEVRFHKEANRFGEHGTMVVTHIKQGLTEVPVRFVFVGLSTPPKLTLQLFTFLWEEAKHQGYVPHDLQTYGTEIDVVNTSVPVVNAVLGDFRGAPAKAS